MHKAPESSLSLLDARLGNGKRICIRIERGRVASLDEPPRAEDLVVDLGGARVLAGLINAHDHLHLNGLPKLKYRDRYGNVSEWIDDIRPRLQTDPIFLAHQAIAREERLLLGGVKNLLSGVTTVAHHDPLYPALLDESFPVRVVTRFGWSHSLSMEGTDSVQRSHRQTPSNQPWIIHAAEGTDAAAANEFSRLEDLGCIASNTVLVHGVALTVEQHSRHAALGGGLAWCPSSNLHLLGRTVDIGALVDRHHVMLGSDSRLSGSRDLLGELRVARELCSLRESELESMVTEQASRVLRLSDRGTIAPGKLADLVVLPAELPLSRAIRTDLSLVMVGGEPCYSDPRFGYAFAEGSATVQLDGHAKCLSRSLAARLRKAHIQEPGLVLNAPPAAVRPSGWCGAAT